MQQIDAMQINNSDDIMVEEAKGVDGNESRESQMDRFTPNESINHTADTDQQQQPSE